MKGPKAFPRINTLTVANSTKTKSKTTLSRSQDREKLSQMSGKSGFGSDDYHARDQRRPSTGEIAMQLQDGANEFATKFVGQAKEDYDNIKKMVQVGGSKLGDILQDLQSRYS
jgi:ADP-ribosylation factor GTPase-activating protein 2/3